MKPLSMRANGYGMEVEGGGGHGNGYGNRETRGYDAGIAWEGACGGITGRIISSRGCL